MRQRVDIMCPSCGKRGDVVQPASNPHDNDNDDVVEMPAPEGFRKVQFGWSNDRVHVCCVDCGVAAVPVVNKTPL